MSCSDRLGARKKKPTLAGRFLYASCNAVSERQTDAVPPGCSRFLLLGS
jgi:hypothetical protein